MKKSAFYGIIIEANGGGKMFFLNRLFFRKRKSDKATAADFAKIDKRSIKYVSERDPDNYGERILGKNGALNIVDKDIVIVCEGREVFRCKKAGSIIAELISLAGVVITGDDVYTGERKTVTAYYQYYRK